MEDHVLVNTNLLAVYEENSVKLFLLLFLIRTFAEVLRLKTPAENYVPFRSGVGTYSLLLYQEIASLTMLTF